ncbi:MAG: 2-oxo acid dehydrogenase subunit E2 [Microthrixaceae bacterium]
MSDTSTTEQDEPTDPVGPNAWLVEEMYEQYLADASSVSPSWQDFFEDYSPPGARNHPGAPHPSPTTSAPGTSGNGSAAAPAAASPFGSSEAPTAAPQAPERAAAPAPGEEGATAQPTPEAGGSAEPPGEEIRGVAKRIVANMEASLAVPTATSYREVPAKLLEINRRVINGYLGRTRGGKVSFTHLIGYALVKALSEHVPAVNSSFVEGPGGEPRVVRNDHVGLGLAIDMEKPDGSRSLIVPCIRGAESMDFAEFTSAYDDLVRKAKTNKLGIDDFSGVTVTLTNPGTIGTERSVPRLMPGQGAIIGVGSLTYPTGFAGSDPETLAELGVSKVITISSTYDHRIIQGAESGSC